MKKILLSISLSLTIGFISAQTYPSNVKAQISQVENNLFGRVVLNGKPDNIIDRMAFYNVKGLSIAVINNFKVSWAKGYGQANEKEHIPVTTRTLFKPGSISKSLNAVGVLKLMQDKKLDLYKDINFFLKSWQFPYDSISKGKRITSANLLSHTAGLSVYGGFPGYDTKSVIPTLPQVLDGVSPANTPAVRSLSEPGIQFEYSGGGILISQLIITDIVKQTYERYMFENILKPLGMINSFYSTAPPRKNEINKYALGYTKDGNEVSATFNSYPEQSAMGLWTTPSDLSKYVIETQLAYQGKSSKVLDKQMANLQLTPYIDNSATMGAFIGDRNGEKYFFHDAGNEGYRGLYYGSVEGGNGMVVFVNSDDGNIILELLNSVASVYNWKGFEKPKNINTVSVPDSITNKYIGVYLYEGKIAEVSKDKGELKYWADGQSFKMYFTSEKEFINMEFPTEKSFIIDGFGNVTGYERRLYGEMKPAATKIVKIDTIKTNEGELNSYGWHLIETKRFEESVRYLSRAMEIEPNNESVIKSLAHALLFNNEPSKALTLYQNFIDKSKNNPEVQKSMIKEDLDYFIKLNLNEALVEKIKSNLKL